MKLLSSMIKVRPLWKFWSFIKFAKLFSSAKVLLRNKILTLIWHVLTCLSLVYPSSWVSVYECGWLRWSVGSDGLFSKGAHVNGLWINITTIKFIKKYLNYRSESPHRNPLKKPIKNLLNTHKGKTTEKKVKLYKDFSRYGRLTHTDFH